MYTCKADSKQAIACCKRGLAEIKGLRQPRAEGALWSSLGYAYSRLGDQQRAIACFERSLNLNRELADLHSEAGKLASLCAVYERICRGVITIVLLCLCPAATFAQTHTENLWFVRGGMTPS